MDPAQRNTKFGILALDDCSDVNLQGPLVLGDEVSVHPGCPIDLPEHWNTSLGSLQAESLTGANLTFTVQIDSDTPTILDAETQQVLQQLLALRFGLFLHGIPDYRNNLIALGGIDGDRVTSVRRIERPPLAYRHRFGRRPTITAETLASTNACANQILALHRNRAAFRRVAAGLRALKRGIEELFPEERQHQYVRALDGLTMLPPGQGANLFSQRAQLFATGTNIADVLVQLYRLRSTQEHLNDFHQVLGELTEAEFQHLGSLRCYQAEQAALGAYQRLLTTPGLLARLESETRIRAFWALDDDSRRTIWGPACDLDVARAHHDPTYALLAGNP